MRKKFRKGAVSILLCLMLIFTQMIPQIISSAESADSDEGGGNSGSDIGRLLSAPASVSGDFDEGDGGGKNTVAAAGSKNNTDSTDNPDNTDGSGNTGSSAGTSADAANRAYEDSDLERPQTDDSGDQPLTSEESQAVLDQVKENLSELSGLEGGVESSGVEGSSAERDGIEGDRMEDESGMAGNIGEDDGADIGLIMDSAAEQSADVSWYTSDETSFTLTTADQLKGLVLLVSSGDSFMGKTVALGNDIDMTDVEWSLPIGNSEEHPFAGTFDGADYTIENFHLGADEKPASFTYTGFFGYLTGNVENLKLRGEIIACRLSGALFTGGLAGYASSAEISGVTADVQIRVTGTDNIVYAGGLVGLSGDTVIRDSQTGGNLNIAGAKNNRTYAGGITGKAEDGGLVVNSGSTGELEVSGETVFAGGLAGYLTGAEDDCLKIHNDYRGGAVKVTSEAGYAGGLVGFAGAYTDVQNCCASGEIEGKKVGADDSDSDSALSADGKEGGVAGEFDAEADESDESAGQTDSSDVSGGAETVLGLVAGGVYSDAGSSVSFCYALAPGQSETGVTASGAGLVGQAGEEAVILGNRLFKADGTFEMPKGDLSSDPGSGSGADENGTGEAEGGESSGAASESGESSKTETVITTERAAELSCCETLYQALNLWVVHERSDEELSDGDESAAGHEVTAKYWSGSGIGLRPDSDRVPTMPQEPTVAVSPKEAFYRVGQVIDENDGSEADDGSADGNNSGEETNSGAGRNNSDEGETGGVDENNSNGEETGGAGGNNSNEGETGGVDENNNNGEETGGGINDGDEDNSGETNGGETNSAGEEKSIPTKGPLTAEIAKNSTESSQGTLTCQWYRCKDETGSRMEAIDRAQEASFIPPTDESGVFYYRLLVICRADETADYDISFSSSWSEVIKVTVGYTVTYSFGVSQSDSISGSLPASGIYAPGSTVTSAGAGDLIYDGYYLRNWTVRYEVFDAEKGENATKTVNISPGDSFVMMESDMTLTGLWAPKTRVTFEKCAADFEFKDEITGEIHTDGFYTPGELLNMPDQGNLQLDGYRFMGWYDAQLDGMWKAGETYEVPGYSTTLYAVWSKAVTLRFTAKEGITGEAPADIETVVGASVTMPECTFDIPVCEESDYFYRFAGWKLCTGEPGDKDDEGTSGGSDESGEPKDDNGTGEPGESGELIDDGDIEDLGESGEPADDDNTGETGKSGESDGTEKSEGTGADDSEAADKSEDDAPVYKAGSTYVVTGDAVFVASFIKVAVWNGSSVASSFGQGAGSAENPYVIETADQLAKLVQDVGGLNGATPNDYAGEYFQLGADIDLNDRSWTPVGLLNDSVSRPFAGYFNGAGHTVSHFKIDEAVWEKTDVFGLFGYVVSDDNKPAIENLKVEEAEILLAGQGSGSITGDSDTPGSIAGADDANICAGLIVGFLTGSMSGCEASGSVSLSSGKLSQGESTGGNGSEGTGTGSNESEGGQPSDSSGGDPGNNAGYVSGGQTAGGETSGGSGGGSGGSDIPGGSGNDSGGNVPGDSENDSGSGNDGSDDSDGGSGDGSDDGDIPGDSGNGSGGTTYGESVRFTAWIGGVAGRAAEGTVSKCVSDASVTVERKNPAEAMAAGGIAGRADKALFIECTNQGNVSLETGSPVDYSQWTEGTLTAGGIAGQICEGSIQNCENAGKVTGLGSDILYVGGIAGYAQSAVTSSTNAGEIMIDTRYVNRSSSDTGTVKGKNGWEDGISVPPAYVGTGVGGIAGYTHSDISLCANTGEVEIRRTAFGSAGSTSGTDGARSTSVTSGAGSAGRTSGALLTVDMAGGLAGGAVNGTISDSYNAGRIRLTSPAGGAAGGTQTGAESSDVQRNAFAGGLVGISGFQAADDGAFMNTDRGETISYVHSFGQVSCDSADFSSAPESEDQAVSGIIIGTLVGRCAYETAINNAYGMATAISSETVQGSESASETAGETAAVISVKTIGDSVGLTQESTAKSVSKGLFGVGEIAYLLDGAKEARNVWTQNGGSYPVLGTPHLSKVTAMQSQEGGSISFHLTGMSYTSEVVYAAAGATVFIDVVLPSEGRTVYKDWTTEKETDDGTTYHRYNSYYGYALFGLTVGFSKSGSMQLIDLEFGINNGRSFEMREGEDAAVYPYFDYGYDTALIDTWFVPKEQEIAEPEPPQEPEVKDHSSAGGKGQGDGEGNGDGTDPGKDVGPGGNDPSGDYEDQQPAAEPVETMPNLTVSQETESVLLPAASVPQPPTESQAPEPESQPEPATDTSVPDSGGESEPEENIEEEVTEEAPEDLTVFEVIQNTIKASPGLMLLLLLLLVLLIAVGGYSRYRKSRRLK